MLGKDDKFGPTELWTERQRQSIHFFSDAIERMRQEGISEPDILFWFQNFMGPYLKNLYKLQIFVGSVTDGSTKPADLKPMEEVEPVKAKKVKEKKA